jgi:integrating conjugative element protein (TIGR03765 family)
MNYQFTVASLAFVAAIQTSTVRAKGEHAPPPPPIVDGSADIESQMLPVRSALLSPGDEPRRAIRAPGLAPFFLVGDDDRSRAWLQERGAALQRMQAVGLVVNVARPQALAALRRLVPELSLMPVSGDDLARRLGIHHYPLLITADGIEQ